MKKTLLIACILWTSICAGQVSLPSVKSSSFLQSPNAANLGQYGSIDISPFTGLPNIDVKVFSVTHGDITVNANLNYLAGGVKPEDHPGWVGQNWTLNVGGVVTRKRNGGVDEVYNSVNLSNPDQFAYWFPQNYGVLNDGNWNTQPFLAAHISGDPSAAVLALLAPDEFLFTLPNGKSGSFFKNHLGQWIVKSNQAGKMLISVDLNSAPVTLTNPRANHNLVHPSLTITRIIQKIVITDDDGFKYTFGDNIDAIEFIRSSKNTLGVDNHNEDVVANAWYLIKIESPKKNVVNFNYERGYNQFTQSPGYSAVLSCHVIGSGEIFNGSSNNGASYSATLINPSYLTDISSSSFKVTFEKEISNDPYIYNGLGTYTPFIGFRYGDLIDDTYGTGPYNGTTGIYNNGSQLLEKNPTTWYKLKRISITDFNNVPRETYSFGYNNDDGSSKRLFLTRFTREHPVLPGPLTDDPIYLAYDQL